MRRGHANDAAENEAGVNRATRGRVTEAKAYEHAEACKRRRRTSTRGFQPQRGCTSQPRVAQRTLGSERTQHMNAKGVLQRVC